MEETSLIWIRYRALGGELRARHSRVDVLLSNAGLIAGSRRTVAADGHELTFQVNHLAAFLLAMLLREPLRGCAGPGDHRGNLADELWERLAQMRGLN